MKENLTTIKELIQTGKLEEAIEKVIKEEEDSFLRTLETGIRLLEKVRVIISL